MSKSGIGLEVVNYRNQFYRSNYRQMLIVVMLLLIIGCTLTGFVYILYKGQATPIYFPTTPDGQPIAMPELNVRHISDAEVIKWTKNALIGIHDFDFVNYRKSLNEARQYFTNKGFDLFMQDFKNTGNLEAVKEKKFVVSAEINDDMPEQINYDKNFHDRFAWQFKIPLVVTYQNSVNDKLPQNYIASVRIVRMTTLEANSGLAIQQLIMERVS